MLLIFTTLFLITIHHIHSKWFPLIERIFIDLFCIDSGVQIEYPPSEHIQERRRTDFDSIDRIFRYYLVPHEIQYHVDALQDRLPYFLRCTGSKGKMNFTVPSAASDVCFLLINETIKCIFWMLIFDFLFK